MVLRLAQPGPDQCLIAVAVTNGNGATVEPCIADRDTYLSLDFAHEACTEYVPVLADSADESLRRPDVPGRHATVRAVSES